MINIPIRFLCAIICCITISLTTKAQTNQYTISGYIEDADTKERLISATIYESNSGKGTVTNEYGFFSLTLEEGPKSLTFSYVGYQNNDLEVDLKQNESFTIALSPSIALETIEITAEKEEAIQEKTQMSQVTVPIEQLKAVPVILGETDVLKSLQLLPGVSGGGEGQTGVYVRGGSPDQNLVLLDGVPVYNVSHLLGLFSVFNADAIKNVTLTKGGFPARYGGRLSSIIDIRMKEGNMSEFHGEGSIGLISSKLTLQGPIVKDKTSFLISGRRTYADLIAKPFITTDGEKPKFHFYDLNAKLQHKINDQHRLYLSAYSGSDIFEFEDRGEFYRDKGGVNWGNIISALRWNWELNPKMFLNTTINFSNYQIDIFGENEEFYDDEINSFSARYTSGIQDIGAKVDLDFIPNPDHYIKAGVSAVRHRYKPGAIALDAISDFDILDTLVGRDISRSTEIDLYVEDDFRLNNLSANIGVHASAFLVENKNYFSVQPRLGLNYRLNDKWSVKGSFATMTQYINLLTSESLSLPTDLWVPSTDRVVPQNSWQAALGIATTLGDDYEFSLEGYYKKMDNVISYKEGANYLFDLESNWEDKITQGDGTSYGAELFLQKKTGRLTGWIGYTLSWNWRQFDEINQGDRFPFRYDRRHDFSIVGAYELGPKVNLSATWSYGTGNAVTLPTSQIPTDFFRFDRGTITDPQNELYIYGAESTTTKNTYRMSAFHRLDVSISFKKKKKKYSREWVIGLYNAYGNKNPFFITSENQYERQPDGSRAFLGKRFKEITVLRFVPSISYNFKF